MMFKSHHKIKHISELVIVEGLLLLPKTGKLDIIDIDLFFTANSKNEVH